MRRLIEFPGAFAPLFVGTEPRQRADAGALWLLACIVVAGTVLRFWGLGAVGLHGDEKTMALPVMSLVNQGLPLMPSGMFYPRAVAQVYLMAASVLAFGQSEWALRLPSALCGVLLIVLTWKVGARFLTPLWNLALAATVAFLPSFIEDAQTARMYVFLVTSVAGYMALLFAWERTGSTAYLVAAVVTMLVGLQFHTLAIFAAFLVFFPGVLHGDSRRFWAGALAFVAIVAGFAAINNLIGLAYPQSVAADTGPVTNGPHAAVIPHLGHVWWAVAALPALAISLWVMAKRSFVAAVLLAVALVAEIAFAWHLAALMVVAALVVGRRAGVLSRSRWVAFFLVSAIVAAGEMLFLVRHAAGSPQQMIGVMLGWPSVWPFISVAEYSLAASLAVAAALAWGLWLIAQRKRVPDHLLLVVLGVWLPLLMIGCMKWNIPPRYAAAQIVPLLVAAFAGMQWAMGWVLRRKEVFGGDASRSASGVTVVPGLGGEPALPAWAPVVAVLACLLVVNPLQVVAAVDSGYASHPDHKGAAEFVEALHPGPHDIIVAEDVLQQTYYLGHVDYWLVNRQVAAPYLHRVNGRWLDFYTDTPLIGTGVELERLVDLPNRGAIYVIGSGENHEDGRGLMRAFGISAALNSPPFRPVFTGRDGLTQVWKVAAPTPTLARDR